MTLIGYNICYQNTVVILVYSIDLKSSNDLGIIYYKKPHSWHGLLPFSCVQENPCSQPWEDDMLGLLHIRVLFIYQLCYCNIVQFCYLRNPPNIENTQFSGALVDDTLHFAHGIICEDNLFPFGVCGTANINILGHTLIKNICIFVFLSINFAFLTAYGLNLLLEQIQPIAS